jgi:16S rRNA (cytosine967-C5)-methyltransferase
VSGKVAPAREAAFRILLKVEAGGHSDDLLFGPGVSALEERDRNLAMALVMGVLRWQIALDEQIRGAQTRPMVKMAAEVVAALRLGVLQLRYMDKIPAHAAVDESVELCRIGGQDKAAPMVNAVLRRLEREGRPAVGARKILVTAKQLAVQYAHPEWLVARWMRHYGAETAETMLAAGQSEPSGDAAWFADADVGWLPQMDAASRLVAEMAASNGAAVKTALDCCAAPGNKTLVLALRMPQAEIAAMDVSAERLNAMRRRLRSFDYAGRVECVEGDALRAGGGRYERILCDVPCSGTGTMGRNPEIRHRLQAQEIGMQARRQREILRAGLEQLASGGRLVYSTCSVEPEENEQVVSAVLERAKGVRVVAAGDVLKELAAAGILTSEAAEMLAKTALRGDYLRTLPGVHACDGFFAAVIERG